MGAAFPPSDYYRASVTMRPTLGGVSDLLGDLAFPFHATYRDWFRSPTHPLNRVHLPDRYNGRSCWPSDTLVGTRRTPPENQRSGGVIYSSLRIWLQAVKP